MRTVGNRILRGGLALGVFVAMWAPVEAGAMYVCRNLSVYPGTGETIPTNVRILLEKPRDGEGSGRDLAPSLLGKAWLEVDGRPEEMVELGAVERYLPGDHQVVLAPTRELRPRTRYVLRSSDPSLRTALEENLEWTRTLAKASEPTRFVWTTGDGPDHSAPIWLLPPVASGSDVSESICPSWSYAVVHAMLVAGAPALTFRATVVDEAGGTTEFLQVSRGRLDFGYGACDTAYLPPGRYRVSLSARDLAGNEAAAPGPPLAFEVPAWHLRDQGSLPTVFGSVSDEPAWWSLPLHLGFFVVAPFLLGFAVVSLVLRRRRD